MVVNNIGYYKDKNAEIIYLQHLENAMTEFEQSDRTKIRNDSGYDDSTIPVPKEKKKYTEQELMQAARQYCKATTGYEPEYVVIDHYEGDDVVIQLFDDMDTHTATYDWYTVNCYTGVGHNLLEEYIDLMNP